MTFQYSLNGYHLLNANSFIEDPNLMDTKLSLYR